MEFHESERALNNFTRTIIVVLVVSSMNPLRVIGERERDILFNCFPDETINRIIHCRDLIASSSRNKERRDFVGIIHKVSNRRDFFNVSGDSFAVNKLPFRRMSMNA